jgi:hypothetical protein
MEIDCMEDWHRINSEDIILRNGGEFLEKFKGSIWMAIANSYKPKKFEETKEYWNSKKNQRR